MENRPRAYFDHAATTHLDPRVLEAMLAQMHGAWGNPSSTHQEGQRARGALDDARARVARVLRCTPAEVVFTSGGTEADNLAIRGVAFASAGRGRHVVTTAIEHHAVLHACEELEHGGFEVKLLPVDAAGCVAVETVGSAVRPDTTLVSVMYANNEIGTVQPLADLVTAAKRANPSVVFHTDAVQAPRWLEIGVDVLGVDLLSLSAHKLGGPKGVGALYVRAGTPLRPQIVGGGQERNRRAGTEDVAGATGLARALELAAAEREHNSRQVRQLAARLMAGLQSIPGCRVTGPGGMDGRLPGIVSCVLEGVRTDLLLAALDLRGFAASSGSACTAGALEPSHVLLAIGVDGETALGSLRLSLAPGNTPEEVERLLAVLPAEVAALRGVSGALAVK